MRSFVADGNFKANHLKQKNDEEDVWLTSGESFMTNVDRYNIHLEQAKEIKMVRDLNHLHRAPGLLPIRHRLATVIGLNSTARPVTTPRIVQVLGDMHAPAMDVSHQDHLLTSRKVKNK